MRPMPFQNVVDDANPVARYIRGAAMRGAGEIRGGDIARRAHGEEGPRVALPPPAHPVGPHGQELRPRHPAGLGAVVMDLSVGGLTTTLLKRDAPAVF